MKRIIFLILISALVISLFISCASSKPVMTEIVTIQTPAITEAPSETPKPEAEKPKEEVKEEPQVTPAEEPAPVVPEPVTPAAPVEPAEPEAPVEPVAPVEPSEPAAPVEPDEPETPVEPVAPVEPAEPAAPVEPAAPAEEPAAEPVPEPILVIDPPMPEPVFVEAPPVCEIPFLIGQTGPAGGIVFFDKEEYTDGWRYLEAAPADVRMVNGIASVDVNAEGYGDAETGYVFGFIRSGANEINVYSNADTVFDENCTSKDVGSGEGNTARLMESFGDTAYEESSGELITSAFAVKLCSDLEYGGYDDWFLPSLSELELMYVNLHLQGLGDFGKGWYRSSSESDKEAGYVQLKNFNTGKVASYMSNYANRVRPVRAF